MSHQTASPDTPLRRDCRRLAKAFFVACLLLAALLLLERFGPWLFRKPVKGDVVVAFIDLIAPGAYLAGLWGLAVTLAAFAQKGRFETLLADGLKGVGLALLFGGTFQTVLAPGLKTLAGHGPGYILGLDAAAIIIAATGSGIWALSRLFRKAARLESELEGIL
jgi:hypothetical protein